MDKLTNTHTYLSVLPLRFLGSSVPDAMPAAEVEVTRLETETEQLWRSSSNASPETHMHTHKKALTFVSNFNFNIELNKY